MAGSAGRSPIQKTRSHTAETNNRSTIRTRASAHLRFALHEYVRMCLVRHRQSGTCWWRRLPCESVRERIDYGQPRLGANRQSQSPYGFFHLFIAATWQFSDATGCRDRKSQLPKSTQQATGQTYLRTGLGLLYSEVTLGKVCVGNSCLDVGI